MNKIYALLFLGLTHIVCLVSMDQQLSTNSGHESNYFHRIASENVKLIFSFYENNDTNEKIVIVETLKTVSNLKCTCKFFYKLLDFETIRLFKNNDEATRRNLLKMIIFDSAKMMTYYDKTHIAYGPMETASYSSNRQLIKLLLCNTELIPKDKDDNDDEPLRSDERKASDKLIYSAMVYNDIELINFLYSKQKINLLQKDCYGTPLCFYARTPQMVELFEKNGINLKEVESSGYWPSNVLWIAVTDNTIPADMVEFYLKKNISTNPIRESSLLHALAGSISPATNTCNLIKKAELLFKEQPHHINALDATHRTPLDCAQEALDRFSFSDDTTSATTLIAFLEKNGGKSNDNFFDTVARLNRTIVYQLVRYMLTKVKDPKFFLQ